MKKYFLWVLRNIYLLGGKWRIFTPSLIIPVDGGICSQMHQYLIGETFRRKGFPVEYSLRFFETCGKDVYGVQVRNFDLLHAFPKLDFKRASRWKTLFYSQCFRYMGRYPESLDTDWINLLPPCCLLGYYADLDNCYLDLYPSVFHIDSTVLSPENKVIYDSIDTDSVAVHVRRGDLSSYNPAYGYPVTLLYFIQSIQYIVACLSTPKFYFFSDDKEYVQTELIPNLPLEISYEIVGNGADKGYVDLMLIGKCSHQITSKGSLGKYGALLNMSAQKIIIVSKDDPQTFMFRDAECTLVVL